MINIFKKKLIPIFIVLIIICVMFSARVNGAVQDTSNYYDAYNSMEHDLDIAKSWMSSNFSSYDEFKNYLSTQFGISTNSHYIAMTDTYSQGTGGRIVLFLISVSRS